MNLWLYCHFPQLLMDTLVRLNPTAKELPVAFFSSCARSREIIVQCNLAAATLGVEKGHTQALAQSFAENLICHQYQPEKEAQLLGLLAEKLYQSVDKLVLLEPKGIAISINSLLRLYQGVEPLWLHLASLFEHWQLQVSMSLGHSLEAAKCLAEAGAEQRCTDKELLLEVLGELSVTQLGYDEKTVGKLQKTGIQQLKQLWLLPPKQVGKRFGSQLVEQLSALKGELPAAVSFYRPKEHFSLMLDLVTEIEHWQGLLFPLKRALKELEEFLYQRQKALRQLTIQLHHRPQKDDLRVTEVPLKLASDSWRASQFLQLIQLQMNRYPLPQPVIAITVSAQQLFDVSSSNGQLLADKAVQSEDLAELLNRLQAKLGNAAVFSPAIAHDLRPLYNEGKQAAGQDLLVPSVILKRPLWLLPTAERVDISCWRLLEGPERLQTGWWDGCAYDRDYWIAEDALQRQGWLFYQNQQWFLQGWFS